MKKQPTKTQTPDRIVHTHDEHTVAPRGVSRRSFLGKAGTVAAAGAAAGMLGGLPSATEARAAPTRGRASESVVIGGGARADQAYAIRVDAAQSERQVARHPDNGDELAYASRIGSYTKGLPHNARGEVDPSAYLALLTCLRSGRSADFDAMPMGGIQKQADPQSGYAYNLVGPDSAGLSVAVPPTFNSAWEAAEMAEMYWQALTRDIPFVSYGTNPLVGKAVADLAKLPGYQGPKTATTATTAFQMGLPGESTGPYLSQFLWQPIAYGVMTVPQLYPVAPSTSFMTSFDSWLMVQNGQYAPPKPPTAPPPPPATRYMAVGRDLATFLHGDFSYQAYLNAALILQKLAVPPDDGNPYKKPKNQVGVGTFGSQHLLDLVAKVTNAAIRACWYQKWLVHRRVRPENFGGRVHLVKTNAAHYPVHADILSTSSVLDAVYQAQGSYLLPMAYPEGSPMHPSYPCGHCVVTGACVTALKTWFDESYVLPTAVVASADGSTLSPYTGAGLTVGGELNKLAGNLAAGRAFGGVHWRSDNLAGLLLGEAVAIGVLADERRTYTQTFTGFSLTKFDGTTIMI
jgi:hypothetical protein